MADAARVDDPFFVITRRNPAQLSRPRSLKYRQLMAQGQRLDVQGGANRINPPSVARTEISTEIIAARAYAVVGSKFNGVSSVVYSSVEPFSRHRRCPG